MRFWAEFEFEIEDVAAARTYTWDWGRDASGEPEYQPMEDDGEAVAWAITALMHDVMRDHWSRIGVKARSGGLRPRPVVDGRHPEFTLPAMPARREDGTFPEDW